MKFSVVIPSKDRREILEANLDRLKKVSNLDDLEVIIVNDSNVPLTLTAGYSFAKIYKNEFGGGVASARNFGVNKASYEWIIFMDDDMWVQPDTFSKLNKLAGDKNHCININWIYPPALSKKLNELPFLRYLRRYGFDSLEGWNNNEVPWNYHHPFKMKSVTSQFLVIHKDAFNKAGGYDESFPFAGFEDHSFSARLRKAGIEVWLDPQNVIYHNESDRIEPVNWLQRKWRGAVTRKVGVAAGFKELTLKYSVLKSTAYKLLSHLQPLMLYATKNWPNISILDGLYFKLINIQLGTKSYLGYNSKEADEYVRSYISKLSISQSS